MPPISGVYVQVWPESPTNVRFQIEIGVENGRPQPIGSAMVWRTPEHRVDWFLEAIQVDEAWRQRGFGRVLIRAVQHWAATNRVSVRTTGAGFVAGFFDQVAVMRLPGPGVEFLIAAAILD